MKNKKKVGKLLSKVTIVLYFFSFSIFHFPFFINAYFEYLIEVQLFG